MKKSLQIHSICIVVRIVVRKGREIFYVNLLTTLNFYIIMLQYCNMIKKQLFMLRFIQRKRNGTAASCRKNTISVPISFRRHFYWLRYKTIGSCF